MAQDSAPPAAPIEVELKLKLSPRSIAGLRARLMAYGAGVRRAIDSVYFDTPGNALGAHGYALRIRRVGTGRDARWIQTLKSDDAGGALARRREWEADAADGRLDVARFPRASLPPALRGAARGSVQARFRTRFRRTTWQVEFGGSALEVALDEGYIETPGIRAADALREAIAELEIEVKRGSPHAAIGLALDLVGPAAPTSRQRPSLRPAVESKAERGYRLAAAAGRGDRPRPGVANADVETIAAGIVGDVSTADALRRAVGNALAVLLRNASGIEASDDPEYVHQARVALRRMREGLRLFGAIGGFPDDLLDDVRWLARALGEARDADVLATETLPPLLDAIPPAVALRIARRVAKARARARRDLLATLEAPRFCRLALRLLAWSQHLGPAGADSRPSRQPLAERAPAVLRREHRRWIAGVNGAMRGGDEDWHRARLRTKRLRYAIELCGIALTGRRAERWLRGLRRLQDALGDFQNAVVAAAAIERLFPPGAARDAISRALERQRVDALRAASTLCAALAQRAGPA